MKVSVYELSTGRILWHFRGSAHGAALQIADGRGVVAGEHPPRLYWVDGGEVAARPQIISPPDGSLPVGADWTVPMVPAGTKVWVDGEHVGTSEADEALVIAFPAPGLWRVELRPPWPWQDASWEVDVTHAD